jgi:L-threonylcarbamoyladenylate synthase
MDGSIAKGTYLQHDATIEAAAALIRAGELVAFPTETVYGLGANALDATAAARIYAAKGRPHSSPLIVHCADTAMARSWASSWPDAAEKLAARFWPGPLTLVLPKNAAIPDNVTAGLPTVGLRVPHHPVALALLRAAGVPIAAPSANEFMQLSPTTAEHVRRGLGDRVACVLDGGPARVGIESTVLSLAGETPVLLRPGMVTQAQLEALIGPVALVGNVDDAAHPAPGLHERHYRPRAPLYLFRHAFARAGRGVVLTLDELGTEPAAYAQRLYAALHEADAQAAEWIAVEEPPDDPAWAGVRDRLARAAVLS